VPVFLLEVQVNAAGRVVVLMTGWKVCINKGEMYPSHQGPGELATGQQGSKERAPEGEQRNKQESVPQQYVAITQPFLAMFLHHE
jgi:hypothetical protein